MEVGTDKDSIYGAENLSEERPSVQSRLTPKVIGGALGSALVLGLLAVALSGSEQAPASVEGEGGKTAPNAEANAAPTPGPAPPMWPTHPARIPCNQSSWQADVAAHGFVADCTQCAPETMATTHGARAREGGCDVALGPIAYSQKCLIVTRTSGYVGGEVICDGAGAYKVTAATLPSAVRTCAPPAGRPPPATDLVTKIAFGACAYECKASQPVLGAAVAHNPDMFIYLGTISFCMYIVSYLGRVYLKSVLNCIC